VEFAILSETEVDHNVLRHVMRSSRNVTMGATKFHRRRPNYDSLLEKLSEPDWQKAVVLDCSASVELGHCGFRDTRYGLVRNQLPFLPVGFPGHLPCVRITLWFLLALAETQIETDTIAKAETFGEGECRSVLGQILICPGNRKITSWHSLIFSGQRR